MFLILQSLFTDFYSHRDRRFFTSCLWFYLISCLGTFYGCLIITLPWLTLEICGQIYQVKFDGFLNQGDILNIKMQKINYSKYVFNYNFVMKVAGL
jgi:hypothetical protein